ncbi:hypothetical protein BGW36DRAFT_210494 [Talaromyces proteolyticus]|uniref:SH3 domain-containing protein n=1 Tax=Talaromyces proteolyticus TaxID=1131652 RepID=A0AAD4PTQ0_9EURO|nr:uncharacterized protein BGW36DRAFT_210494 [Talaromyces proteolyticus]KAH8693773.1 hypothetical protein BGW36DRAFT_210494 [Talaromyces proteolyticus]
MAASPPAPDSGILSPNTTVPPIVTDVPGKLSPMRRISSSAKDRLSVYSTVSQTSQYRSRPVSHVFPLFHSSLPYALVRDFAYSPTQPLHYGPLPASSRASTPASESRRLSDPQTGSWDGSRTSWSTNNWSSDTYGGPQLPAVSFADGPPYSEDEDLHSPIVTSRHRKHKSMHTYGERGRSPGEGGRDPLFAIESDRGTLVSLNGDGSETYYVRDENADDDGPGGEFITYPANEGRYSGYAYGVSHTANYRPPRGSSYAGGQHTYDDEYSDPEQSRYSRDYQFSIGSPDEEMHGKAIALFDFTREHENELPLKEGQVILVSYRHGQGWLVAEDPRTGESGLVPEEFVRLVRDIEGGLNSLNGELSNGPAEGNAQPNAASMAEEIDTPTEEEQPVLSSESLSTTNGNHLNKHPSTISTFSTSSRDLSPYPPHLLGDGQGKVSPPIEKAADGVDTTPSET